MNPDEVRNMLISESYKDLELRNALREFGKTIERKPLIELWSSTNLQDESLTRFSNSSNIHILELRVTIRLKRLRIC